MNSATPTSSTSVSVPVPSTTVENTQSATTTTDADSNATGTIRPSKRKLNDIFHGLDKALGPLSDDIDNSRPTKRTHTSRSIYSTLTKYGIKGRDPTVASSTPATVTAAKTPHLSAILTRTTALTRKAIPSFKTAASVAATYSAPIKEYSTTSVASFVNRLATYKLATYANKPPQIDAVAAARCGWINDGKDRLLCEICSASWVVAGRDGMSREAAAALVEKQRTQLVSQHKNLCPWKDRQCDPSIYRIPLRAPSAMAKELKHRALSLEQALKGVHIRHPLSQSQIRTLTTTLSTITLSAPPVAEVSPPTSNVTQQSVSEPSTTLIEPSDVASIVALFGWTLAPPVPPERPKRPAVSSISRVLQTRPASRALSITHSRSTSASAPPSRQTTPAPGPSALGHAGPSISVRPSSSSLRRASSTISATGSEVEKKGESAMMLHCPLCQRRLGMWAFCSGDVRDTTTFSDIASSTDGPDAASGTQVEGTATTTSASTVDISPSRIVRPLPHRQFDVLKEHRAYCPYAVPSTIIPTFSAPTPSTGESGVHTGSSSAELEDKVEGWRAVLSVVGRYGLEYRQRLRRLGISSNASATSLATAAMEDITIQDGEMEIDRVGAMVDAVKNRGGSSVLKYVKNLLG